ncbi:MAG: ParB/RepB/Spo0J family partition protein [Legionella sp.]|nr:ParB/RepB/Spo0J family partition protein [Legionella sp.]
MHTEFLQIPIDQLQSGQYQPRENFDLKALEELAQSIESQGLIEPLIVRNIALHRFEIIAGERRWRAAKIAGLTQLPCLVGNYNDKQACALSLIENIQREDLNLIEEASAYKRLMNEFHYQQAEIALLMGKSRSHIANIMRLLSLTNLVKQHISDKSLSLGHARMLVGLDPVQQEGLALQCIEQHWSVRQLEQVLKHRKQQPLEVPKNPKKDRDIERLQVLLSEQLGHPVQISSDSDQGGWFKVQFFDNDTLAGLLERLGLRYD